MSDVAVKYVSSVNELIFALKTATGGETILLADGDYGSVTLDSGYRGTLKRYPETVTIAALNPGEATFKLLDIMGASNLALDGLTVETSLKVRSSSTDVSIRNTQTTNISLRDVDGLELSNNDIGGNGGGLGLVLQSVSNGNIQNNYIHETTEDLVRVIGDSHHLVIQNNLIADTVAKPPTHPDLIQMYGYGGKNPHDITIRGNVLYDDTSTGSTGAQGIFMADPQGEGYRNILVEQNLISVQHTNTIFISGGEENVVIKDNSLLATQGSSGGLIRVHTSSGWTNDGVYVDGNVLRGIYDSKGAAEVGDNYSYGMGSLGKATNDQSDIYQSPSFIGWESFLPVAGSGIDFGSGYGAQERLAELLAGMDNDAGVIRQAFEAAGAHTFHGKSTSYKAFSHSEALELEEATIALDFNLSSISGQRGIISKNSNGLSDGFYAHVDNGTLKVTFEGDSGSETISHAGIVANHDYDLAVSFEDGYGRVWLDGALVGEVATDMDWTQNVDNLLLGAISHINAEGQTARLKYFAKGEVSDLRIYDTAMSIDELHQMEGQRKNYLDAITKPEDWSKVAAYLPGKAAFSGLSTTKVLDAEDFALDEATVMLNFNASATSWYRGLAAKNSAGLNDGFDIFLASGKLNIRFEDDEGTQTITTSVSRLTDYKLIVSFEDGKAEAWLNGSSIGSVETGMNWEHNSDSLIVGALNTNSKAGTTSNMATPFSGSMNGFMVLNEGMTADEVAAYVDTQPSLII